MTGSWPVVRMITLETLTLETLTLETSCLTSCLVRGGATVDSVASAGEQVALGLLDNIGQWTKFIVHNLHLKKLPAPGFSDNFKQF